VTKADSWSDKAAIKCGASIHSGQLIRDSVTGYITYSAWPKGGVKVVADHTTITTAIVSAAGKP
jgi:hypothetical protein